MPDDPVQLKKIRSLRATDSQWEEIRERARQAGYTRSAYILKAALEGRPRPRPGQPTQDAIYHLARIGNNLNQLAHAANTPTRLVESGRIDEILERVIDWIEGHT